MSTTDITKSVFKFTLQKTKAATDKNHHPGYASEHEQNHQNKEERTNWRTKWTSVILVDLK